MSGKLDVLSCLFTQVVGRKPHGAEVSEVAVREKLAELTAEVISWIDVEMDELTVPPSYLSFWSLFGGEKALTNRMTTLYAPEMLETSISHLIFGLHQAADRYFGIDHCMLEEEDPPTAHAPTEEIRSELDEDADGDDSWDDFTETLTDGLLEIATENLLRSLKRRVSLSDCSSRKFESLLSSLESLYGDDLSEVTASMLIYFGRGILVSYEQEENAAMIAFDSDKREAAFRKQFPQAK